MARTPKRSIFSDKAQPALNPVDVDRGRRAARAAVNAARGSWWLTKNGSTGAVSRQRRRPLPRLAALGSRVYRRVRIVDVSGRQLSHRLQRLRLTRRANPASVRERSRPLPFSVNLGGA